MSLKLDMPVVEIAANRYMLGLITAHSKLRVIDIKSGKAIIPSTSISHLLQDSKKSDSNDITIIRFDVRPNGVTIILTSEPSAYLFDPRSQAFMPIITPYQLRNSPLLSNTQTLSAISPTGPLLAIESEITNLWNSTSAGSRINGSLNEEEWFDEALTMSHFEQRIKVSDILESKEEYKYCTVQYCEYLANGNFKARAGELINDLMGPLYR